MMHSFIGFLFDLITCQVKFNKKEEKVSLISYKYMYVILIIIIAFGSNIFGLY